MATHPNSSKTHCKLGHPFDEANTYHYGRSRACKTCRAIRARTPKAVLRQQRLERQAAKQAATQAAKATQKERDHQRLQARAARAIQKALAAVAEAKHRALMLTPVRHCRHGHPFDPTFKGCRECSKLFLRRKRKKQATRPTP